MVAVEEPSSTTTHWRGSVLRAALLVLTRVSAFVTAIIVARSLPPADSGSYFLALAITPVASIALSLGQAELLARTVPALDQTGSRALSDARARRSFLTVCSGSVVALLVGIALALSGHVAVGAGIAIGSAVAGQTVGASFLRARGRIVSAEGWTGAVAPIFLGIVTLLVHFEASGTVTLAFRFTVEVACACLVLTTALREAPKIQQAPRIQSLSIAGPLWFASVAWLCIQHADVMILGAIRGPRAVAVYAPILKIADLAAFSFGVLGVYLLPEAARLSASGDWTRLRMRYSTMSKLAFALAAPVMCVMVFAPGTVIEFVFGISGNATVVAGRLLGLAYFFNAAAGLNGAVVDAIVPTRLLLRRSAAVLAITMLADLVLISALGVVGAAAGTLVGLTTLNVASSALLFRFARITPFADLLLPIEVAVLAFGGALIWFFGRGITSVSITAVSVLVFGVWMAWRTTPALARTEMSASFLGKRAIS